jgi:hypothetical protein
MDQKVTFHCQYYDERTVQLPRGNLTYSTLYYAILAQFDVNGITIMHGEQFIESQEEFDQMLAGMVFSMKSH